MKRSEKIERIRMLYELESLVFKKKKTAADKKRIKELRNEFSSDSPGPGKPTSFDLDQYLSIQKKYPGITDMEIAKLMGVARSTILLGKKRHGISKKYKKETA